jgi:formylmethanofuran dehydrogenase subunit D
MLFTLEALEAKHGDALILHYGKKSSPKLIVIDGGPAGVYKKSLRPRLDELKETRSPDEPLEVRMLMVSHLDDDHVNGVLALSRDLAEQSTNGEDPDFNILTLWCNTFDDIIGNESHELAASLAQAAAASASPTFSSHLGLKRESAVIVASVPQGRELRGNAKTLAIPPNDPFKNLVVAPATGKKALPMGDGLKLTVIGPNEERVVALQEEWNKIIQEKGFAKDTKGKALAAAFVDDSVFNLSSIVVLAEADGKKMLLTGDARGDDIMKGLTSTGFLKKNKPFHVDLLKLPHHGSDNNVETDFFRQVTADHYVVSGDGRFGNPEIAALQMISEARGKSVFTLHLTNKEARLEKFFKKEKAAGKKYKVVYRDENDLSLRVDLGEALGD